MIRAGEVSTAAQVGADVPPVADATTRYYRAVATPVQSRTPDPDDLNHIVFLDADVATRWGVMPGCALCGYVFTADGPEEPVTSGLEPDDCLTCHDRWTIVRALHHGAG